MPASHQYSLWVLKSMASPLGNLRSVVLRSVLFEPSVKARSILALSSSQSVQNNNLIRRQKSYALISLKEQRLIKGVVVRRVCSSVHRCLCFCYELLFFERASNASAEHKRAMRARSTRPGAKRPQKYLSYPKATTIHWSFFIT